MWNLFDLVARTPRFKSSKNVLESKLEYCKPNSWYRVVNAWNALPANIVSASSSAMFKACLNDLDLPKFAVLF